MNYPIRTSTRTGARVFTRVRCDLCSSANIKTLRSDKDTRSGVTVRYCECRDCKDLRTMKPHRFKATIV